MAFIVLDGPDATGTTTHAELLAERLQREGHNVLLTMEPTDGPIGTRIREELSKGNMDPMALQILFTEDRAWHVSHVIEPALKAGKTVICDRYWHSTIVYAQAQGLPTDELQKLNDAFVQPDVVIFTLPPIEVSLERMGKRAEKEFFEREDLQRKIHDGYRKMARGLKADQTIRTWMRWEYPITRIFSFYEYFMGKEHVPTFATIDTSGEKQTVSDQIWKVVKKRLSR